MPDLKTELSKVINQWNQPEEPTMTQTKSLPVSFQVSNNVCRATFECIQKNPGKTRKEVIEALLESGYQKNSTTSLIGQMIKQGHVRASQGLVYANFDEYRPLKSNAAYKKLQEAATRKNVVITKSFSTAAPVEKPAKQAAVQINSSWDADTILNHLSIKQARALFDELRKIFGG